MDIKEKYAEKGIDIVKVLAHLMSDAQFEFLKYAKENKVNIQPFLDKKFNEEDYKVINQYIAAGKSIDVFLKDDLDIEALKKAL